MDDFFHGLSSESIRKLEESQRIRRYETDEVIFLEGDVGHSVYRLRSGTIRLFRTTSDGREVTIHMVRAGELFAEIVLFERDTYPVSASAVVQSEVGIINRTTVHTLLSEGAFREEFLKNLIDKMRFLSQQIYVLATMDVRQRLLRFFAVRYGRKTQFTVDLSKTEIATAISVRPETLSRTLGKLDASGELRWKGRPVYVEPALWEIV